MSKHFKHKAPVEHMNDAVGIARPALDPDQLDAVIDKSRYGRDPSGAGEGVMVKGVRYPLNKVINIAPELVVRVFKGNKRKSPVKVEELADSIVSSGRGRNNEPALVRPMPDGQGFELIKGSRRLAAVNLINDQGLASQAVRFHCIVKEMDDREATLEAALENLKREDLSPWEMADQLNELLISGACGSVEELIPHLPVTGKRNPDRTLAYYYLNPAKIAPAVRAVIDEDAPVRLYDIQTLKKSLTSLEKANRLDGFVSHLHEHFSKGSMSVGEVQIEVGLYNNETPKTEKGSAEIQDASGKVLATIRHGKTGGASIALKKDVPQEKISAVLEAIQAILNQ
jgi:hypothetical protein